MSEYRRKSGWEFWASAVLIAAVGIGPYGLAYFKMAGPTLINTWGPGPWEIPPRFSGTILIHSQSYWTTFFAPAHWLDRRLRPERWVHRLPESFVHTKHPTK
jgi:hypothetical protein